MILKAENYPIFFGNFEENILQWLDSSKYSKTCIIVDENTRIHCLPKLFDFDLPNDLIIEIPSGEKHKTIESAEMIWQKMLLHEFDRHSLCINLGGGIIGDMGGFAAACYKRGIDFVQIPTTLLSQVDASVGGKVGVNFQGIKNIIGAFSNPAAVFIHTEFLNTLPSRHITSGFAEIIKHALISDDELWQKIESEGLRTENLDLSWIYRAVATKLEIVTQDPFEQDVRKILNFGHTIGHAIESQSYLNKKPLYHGEAIYVGMVCEAFIAKEKKYISQAYLERITTVLTNIFYDKNAVQDSSKLWDWMKNDKKNKRNQLLMSLLNGHGTCTFDVPVSHNEVLQSFSFYQNLF